MNHVDRASGLEVQWRKSSRSNQGSECVEIGATTAFTAVRDSKNPAGPALVFTPGQWAAFQSDLKFSNFET